MRQAATLCLLLMGLSGCFVWHEEDTRTYPKAFDIEPVPLQSMLAASTTGAYNVEAYVTERFVCPPNADCFPIEGIVLSENPDQESEGETIVLKATKPEQFAIGAQYLMTIEVRPDPGIVEGDAQQADPLPQRMRLLGYTEL